MKTLFLTACFFLGMVSLKAQSTTAQNKEMYRPQLHFSPTTHWMNDPNGMVYYKGKYHLFYQFYPEGTVWGPMHWAHASSKDLVHWDHLPIALYPDSLGYIFSGSAVVDAHNTSGFGEKGKVPLVAIFTHHNPVAERAHKNNFQSQSLAYSLDEGKTWEKYSGNPVLKSPGITDFRDPKVTWFEPGNKWIMTLATKDRITFYSAPDLKNWTKESEFGVDLGAHGGVWECPDLFPLTLKGKKYWVLLVSLNPGAPNGGSGTQYFIGDFDGKEFKPINTATRWIDYGPDNYAGITWSNTGERKIFIGWMNNWNYADRVPTVAWRGAATLPRELRLVDNDGEIVLSSTPVKELDMLNKNAYTQANLKIGGKLDLLTDKKLQPPYKIKLTSDQIQTFALKLSNPGGEELSIGYDKQTNHYFIDRTKSGNTSFESRFSKVQFAPKIDKNGKMDMTIFVDVASVELFADAGLTTMTTIYFPNEPMNKISVQSEEGFVLKQLKCTLLKSVH